MPKHMYGGQKTNGGGWVSHSTMWAPEIHPAHGARLRRKFFFTHWAILPA